MRGSLPLPSPPPPPPPPPPPTPFFFSRLMGGEVRKQKSVRDWPT